MLDRKYLLLVAISPFLLVPVTDAGASGNPNLFVSAENPRFDNHFSGSMVVEVVVMNNAIGDTGEGSGEPDVTVNGKDLRMVQATDGNWYAYFANVQKARAADSTVGLAGQGLDFGVFCSSSTESPVFGVSFSDSDGFAVPRSGGLAGFADGDSELADCTGSPTGSANLNNVVRKAKSINANPGVPAGQIGLDPDAWPVIQLYSFGDVTVRYNPGGPSQQVSLEYDEIPNISMELDRELYPQNAEVFLTINDAQLNQDPTDEDSWTFEAGPNPSTFYRAYGGPGSANGGAGLVDLVPHLSRLGFEDNGRLAINLGSVLEMQSNSEQPATSATDGVDTFTRIVTLVERGPNSGIFEGFDSGDRSVLKISGDAPRGQAGTITYNRDSVSVLTGPSTASVTLAEPVLEVGSGQRLSPGTEYSVILTDPDQNVNSGTRDSLDAFRADAIIPTVKIGNPTTLENAYAVQFHASSPVIAEGEDADSSMADPSSERLVIDTSSVPEGRYEMISVNLGVSTSELSSVLLDVSESGTHGTSWINYDLRSLADLGVSDFSDASFTLSFGTLGASPVTIADAGDISPHGLLRIDDSDISDISGASGTVFLVIDFDSSGNDAGVISVSGGTGARPVIFDIFSFGLKGDQSTSNSVYRFELEETHVNSSVFEGTIEYAVTNQLNILDPGFIRTIQTIDDEIKIIVTDRLVDEDGIAISYSDLDRVGVVTTATSKSELTTHTGNVALSSTTFRFGQPVTITLNDPDLNLKSDRVDIYLPVNDPGSPIVDTIGRGGEILLEVKIKDVRYERCTIDSVEYGGLASTGFTLVETGRDTGVFEGVFKMPSKICDKTGTKLISPAGGSIDVRYYDARDASGNSNIFSLLNSRSAPPTGNPSPPVGSLPQLSAHEIQKPSSERTEEVTLSGRIDNHKRGVPLSVTIILPDGASQSFGSALSSGGSYKSVIAINDRSPLGVYRIDLSHDNHPVGTATFTVSEPGIPAWIKDSAGWWAGGAIPDSEFIGGIEFLMESGVIATASERGSADPGIPAWLKSSAGWWSGDQISDEEFLRSIEYLVKKGIIRV